jgi:hypothetical protein
MFNVADLLTKRIKEETAICNPILVVRWYESYWSVWKNDISLMTMNICTRGKLTIGWKDSKRAWLQGEYK